MANIILNATLYKAVQTVDSKEDTIYIIKTEPEVQSVYQDDIIYLYVTLGNVPSTPHTSHATINFEWTTESPFDADPPEGLKLRIDDANEMIQLGTIKNPNGSPIICSYKITITYNGKDYVEDPKIKVNPPATG